MALINVRKKITENPFFYKGYDVPAKYFCDREKETRSLVNMIENDNNLILKSPRRLGKTSLLWHVFDQKNIKDKYNTIYVDIYPTKSEQNFVETFYKAIQDCPTIKNKKDLDNLRRVLDEISLTAGVSKSRGTKFIGIKPAARFTYIQMEKSLEAVFTFLAKTSRPNLIVIDEFQQIQRYGENGIEASLRTFVQGHNNSNFIFSGSSRHILSQMFDSADKPFYRSCRSFNLDVIPYEAYADFCMSQFMKNERSIDEDAIKMAYYAFSGVTLYMQMAMNNLYSKMVPGEKATADDMKEAIEDIISEKDQDYAIFMNSLKPNQERILCCIANESPCDSIYSTEKRDKYGLPGASSTKSIIDGFLAETNRSLEIVSPGVYRVEDKLLELWIAKNLFNNLDTKLAFAEVNFKREQELRKQKPKFQEIKM